MLAGCWGRQPRCKENLAYNDEDICSGGDCDCDNAYDSRDNDDDGGDDGGDDADDDDGGDDCDGNGDG